MPSEKVTLLKGGAEVSSLLPPYQVEEFTARAEGKKIFVSHSEDETRELGKSFAKNLRPGQVILLFGDLGTGKTVFVRGVGEALKISGVRSPSFTLINEYESPTGIFLIHVDLYRLDSDGVAALGLEEYENDCVLFVEWPERWQNPPVKNVTKIFFSALNETEREIIFS